METDSQITIHIPEENVFHLKEHETFKPEHLPYIASLGLNFEETGYECIPKFLGITPDFRASYYIGAEWLNKNKAVVITPKMPDIDHVSMFMSALRFAPSSDYFTKFYGINYSKQKIESETLDGILTPFLIIHFIFSVQRLLGKGLKKGYIVREENLHAKVKGKILISRQCSKNIANHRSDRVMCSYQEYSADIPENRLIKKALLFAKKSLSTLPALKRHSMFTEIHRILSSVLKRFDGVGENIDPKCVKAVSKNKLFGNYESTIKSAKQLLKRYDYSIDNVGNTKNMVPPFWIDMSRLYEVYVYGLLQKAYPGQIKFQVKGHYSTAVDFLKMDEKLIMDTKYKPHYRLSNAGCIEDIREISGYARDEYILRELNIAEKDTVPDCLIIYPEMEDCCSITAFTEGKPLIPESTHFNSFRKFHKICVPVPISKRPHSPSQ